MTPTRWERTSRPGHASRDSAAEVECPLLKRLDGGMQPKLAGAVPKYLLERRLDEAHERAKSSTSSPS